MPSAISATVATESARSAWTSLPCERNRRAARRATSRARDVSSRSSVRDSVSSHSAWKFRRPWSPYADAAASRARMASVGPARSGQHLGPVAVAYRAAHRRQRCQDRARGVHRLQGADEIAGEEPGVPEVVLGAGPPLGCVPVLQQVDRLGQVVHRSSGIAAQQVQACPVEQRPAHLAAAVEQADGRRVVNEGGAVVADVLVHQRELRPDHALGLRAQAGALEQRAVDGEAVAHGRRSGPAM